MFGGPVHILFAQCIPAGSLFMSISPLIRVRLPTRFLWVKEPTCEAAARALDSWESLPSINMAKLFLHMANYLCKVILAGGWFPDIWVGYSAQMVLPAPGVSFHFVFPPSFLSRLGFLCVCVCGWKVGHGWMLGQSNTTSREVKGAVFLSFIV